MPRKSVVSYKSSRRNQQWGATWDILIRNWTDIYYWTKRFRHTKQNVTSRWSCAIYYANTMLRVFDTVQGTEMLWVYSTAVPEFSKALTCVSTLTYLRLGHEWLTLYRHLVTDFVQNGIGYHWILDGSILEVKSLLRSTTFERINCRSEVNSMDSEFPARNHFPFSWHSPPVQKKGRHEEDIIRYLLMIQNISAAIYIL